MQDALSVSDRGMMIALLAVVHEHADSVLALRIVFSICLAIVFFAGIYILRIRKRLFDRNGGRRRAVVVDVADETKPALVLRANEVLVVAAVAERTPCRVDAGAERRLRNDAALPNRVDQLVLANDPVAVPYLAAAAKRKEFASMMIAALARLKTTKAVEALVLVSQSGDPETAASARAALTSLGMTVKK